MLENSYPFRFIMNEYEEEPDEGFSHLMLFKFKSTKSNLTYIVRVEVYKYHIYAVKFYLKNMQDSKNKYRIATNTYEPRRIINTCINIMLSIYEKDPEASFGFIGANGLDEDSTYCTKRYRFYSRLMATYFSNEKFYHKENKAKSAYMLINNKVLDRNPDLVREIETFFAERYDYFD
mgnify:FL=1